MGKPKKPKKQRKSAICLNMIVKDEAHIIERCLNSVMPYIDTWVIADTGSTDGTQELIRKLLKDIPGELVEHEWKDFGHNRNEALKAASGRADYVFFMDADDWFETEKDFGFGALQHDCYQITKHNERRNYWVPMVVKNDAGWRWEGVLHEYLINDVGQNDVAQIHGAVIQSRREGARSLDPMKYHKDAALLTRALTEDPDNSRYRFYLAQSWRDAEDYEQAITHYGRRAEMEGWHEEVFFSLYQIAYCMEYLGRDWPSTLSAYMQAWNHTPARAEPLYRIAANYYDQGDMALAKLFFALAANTPTPDDLILFVERAVYEYMAAFYAGSAAENLGEKEEAKQWYQRVVDFGEEGNHLFEAANAAVERCGEIEKTGEEVFAA